MSLKAAIYFVKLRKIKLIENYLSFCYLIDLRCPWFVKSLIIEKLWKNFFCLRMHELYTFVYLISFKEIKSYLFWEREQPGNKNCIAHIRIGL